MEKQDGFSVQSKRGGPYGSSLTSCGGHRPERGNEIQVVRSRFSSAWWGMPAPISTDGQRAMHLRVCRPSANCVTGLSPTDGPAKRITRGVFGRTIGPFLFAIARS